MLRAHFLSVGNGDCTIVELPDGEIMVVDVCNGNGTDPKCQNPVTYLSKRKSLIRYIQTHPEMDHMDGLAALSAAHSITNFWDTKNTRKAPDFCGPYTKGKPGDWKAYERLRAKSKFYYRNSKPITLQDGKALAYNLYVLHPTKAFVTDANKNEDWNLLSYVVLFEYKGVKFLLGGDASDTVWQDIYDWSKREQSIRALLANVHVFKVSHHGRRTSYCGQNILKLTNPKHIVISRGSVPGEQSAYGSYYKKVGSERLWLTSRGNIVASFDDSKSPATRAIKQDQDTSIF